VPELTHKVVVDLDLRLNTDGAKAKLAEIDKLLEALGRSIPIGMASGGAPGAAPSPAPGASATGAPSAGGAVGPIAAPGGGPAGGLPAPTATPGGTVPTASSRGWAVTPGGIAPTAPPGSGSPASAPTAAPGGGVDSIGDEPEPTARPNELTPEEQEEIRRRRRRRERTLMAVGYGVRQVATAGFGYWKGGDIADIAATADTSGTAGFTLAAGEQQRQGSLGRSIGGAASLAGIAFGGPAGIAITAASTIVSEIFGAMKDEAAEKIRADARAVDFYGQSARRAASVNEQQNMLALSGALVNAGPAERYGYGPEEALGIASAFAGGAGRTGASSARAMAFARAGVSPGAAGSYFGLTAAGAGGFGRADPESMVGLAQAQGLRGSKVDEFLSIIASATTSLASQGMKLDLASSEAFARRLNNTSGFKGQGLAQARAVSTMAGIAGGARQRLLAPFTDMADQYTMALALQRSTSLEGAAEYLERADPMALSRDFAGSGMSEVLGLSLASRMSVQQGRAISRGALGPDTRHGMIQAKVDPMKQQIATNDWTLVNRVSADEGVKFLAATGDQQLKVLEHGMSIIRNSLDKMNELLERAWGTGH